MSRPDVSVIIVVHNDAEHLVHSVNSAREQSLDALEILIVDDCSDDDTLDAANELARADQRVRVLQTERNSGGPGAPRNVGLQQAQAPWVTFLDSDDLLEPHAVASLFAAGEQDSADVVCGMTRRVFLGTDEAADWHEELFGERRRLASIAELLDLVVVTTATGKLYRREFLREHAHAFLEDLHYEDLVFSAQVFATTRSISIVPERVYVWNVYPTDERTSITQQRADERNLRNRLEAVQRVEAIAAASGKEGLLERYQLKLLQHDAHLYLRDLVRISDEEAERVLATLAPKIRRIPAPIFDRLSVHDRLLYGMALCGSVEGVRELKPAIKGHVLLEGRTVVGDGRTVWRPSVALDSEPASGSLESRLLDITGDAILGTPFSEIRYAHRVLGIERASDDRAIVRGCTADPLGRMAAETGRIDVWAVATACGTDLRLSWPVEIEQVGDQRFEWEFEIRVPRSLPYVRPLRLDIALEVDRGGETNVSPIWLHKGADVPRLLPQAGTVRAFLREWFSFSRVGAGRVTLKLSEPHGRRGRIDVLVHRAARFLSPLS